MLGQTGKAVVEGSEDLRHWLEIAQQSLDLFGRTGAEPLCAAGLLPPGGEAVDRGDVVGHALFGGRDGKLVGLPGQARMAPGVSPLRARRCDRGNRVRRWIESARC